MASFVPAKYQARLRFWLHQNLVQGWVKRKRAEISLQERIQNVQYWGSWYGWVASLATEHTNFVNLTYFKRTSHSILKETFSNLLQLLKGTVRLNLTEYTFARLHRRNINLHILLNGVHSFLTIQDGNIKKSRHFIFGDHFLYSHELSVWLSSDRGSIIGGRTFRNPPFFIFPRPQTAFVFS